MLDRFQSYIRKNNLFAEEDKLLLAFSGGVDSTVLFFLLLDGGYRFAAAHMNYMLRGRASQEDALFAEKLARTHHVPFHLKNINAISEARKAKTSVQMLAREARYGWFDKLKKSEGYTKVLTAHHANDNVETVLFNLAKGTGVRGLRGISAGGQSVKPLLFATKKQISAYAESRQITWREDASNKETLYGRNKIRHHVIPALEDINSSFVKKFESTQKRLIGVEQLLIREAEDIRSRFVHRERDKTIIDVSWVEKSEWSQVVLLELLSEFGFVFSQVEQVFEALFSAEGQMFVSPLFRVNVDRNRLIVVPVQKDTLDVHVHIEVGDSHVRVSPQTVLQTAVIPKAEWHLSRSPQLAQLDFDLLHFPLMLRKWQKGDRFRPLGMKGTKKISDLLTDRKLSVVHKEEVLVLLSGGEICWVVGHRIDHRFGITDQSSRVFVIEATKNP